LFPKTVKALPAQTEIIEVETTHSCSEVLSSGSYDQVGCKLAPSNFVLNNINGSKLPMDYSYFWEMFEALKSILENGGYQKSFLPNAQVIKVMQNCFTLFSTWAKSICPWDPLLNFPLFLCKYQVDVDKSIHLVSTVMNESLQNTIYHGDENLLQEVACMLDELKLLSVALGVR
jgi:hypothetical protein